MRWVTQCFEGLSGVTQNKEPRSPRGGRVRDSPRSFFSFEKESNLLRRDFLRLCVSVGEKNRDSIGGAEMCRCSGRSHTARLKSNHLGHRLKFKRPCQWRWSFSFPGFLLSRKALALLRIDSLFNRADLVVCWNNPSVQWIHWPTHERQVGVT